MADPFTWISIGFTVLGGLNSMAGAQQSAQAESDAYNYQAQINLRNKQLADQDRNQALATAQLEAEDKRRENARKLSSIRASYGTTGLELAGSPLDVLADTAREMTLEERRIEYEGDIRYREGTIKMQGYQEEANMNLAAAGNAKQAGKNRSTAAFFGAGSQVAQLGGQL